MPEKPYGKIRPAVRPLAPRCTGGAVPEYVELQACSNFSFLRGASHPEELIERAFELSYRGLALTDLNSLAGVVRAHQTAGRLGLPFFTGCRLEIEVDRERNYSLLVYPLNRASYGGLCRLLTAGNVKSCKGECRIMLTEFLEHSRDLAVIAVPPDSQSGSGRARARRLFFPEFCRLLRRDLNRQHIFLGLGRSFYCDDVREIRRSLELSKSLEIPAVVTGNVCYHVRERKLLQDVLSCIRSKCTLSGAGFILSRNAERHLKPAAEIYRLFRDLSGELKRTLQIAEMLQGFSLEELRYEYPDEICPTGMSPSAYLAKLVRQGARERYPQGVPEKVAALIREELALIRELEYEKYFLTCHDIVRFARARGILCQGRGAAANSAVCFCLGITSVDPDRIDLLFARFVSRERNEPPDIDIDFEHERREEVIQYIYGKYGRERAGLTCEVITYRHRSAVRDAGKVFGLSPAAIDRLAKSIHRWTECRVGRQDLLELGLDPDDKPVHNTIAAANMLLGFPRHLSQHVGGFIISERPLCETVPILNAAMPQRTIIEWDKDDIDALGMLKIDVLGLGMLSCIRKALEYVNRRRSAAGRPALELHSIPAEDPQVYDMICVADTIGVFQIESRAQMSMLPRLKPRCFYDLVIEVAIVRPGPIQGNMVHPYLKRRSGIEKAFYPDDRVQRILGKTLGVPLFQEQAMRLAIVLAQFSPDEAEQLRRAMAAWKKDKGIIAKFKDRILAGMQANGYSREFAESCMDQIKGFSEYGFPESHAASFALLVYASAWLKKYYPAEFACALLNSQPMGFYAPAQIVSDAGKHGVEVLAADVNKSTWDCSLQGDIASPALRLGLRLVKNLGENQAALIGAAITAHGESSSVEQMWKRIKGSSPEFRKSSLEALARADCFVSMGLNRRQALWQIKALPDDIRPLDNLMVCESGKTEFPPAGRQLAMFQDYAATGLSLRAHPLEFAREYLAGRGVSSAGALRKVRNVRPRSRVSIAGLAIFRQRPGTARGVVFITLEDETGIANLIVRPEVYEKYRRTVLSSSVILAEGTLERVGEVVYVSVERLESLDKKVLRAEETNLPLRSYAY